MTPETKLVAAATDENGSPVSQREYNRLKKIESMAMACNGIDMGMHYDVHIDEYEALMSVVWDIENH